MSRRRKKSEMEGGFKEPDLTPIMNLTFILIAGVLTMTSMAIGLISVQAPKLGGGGGASSAPQEPKKKALNLTIFITGKGFNLAASEATLDGASVGRPGEAYFPKTAEGKLDFVALQKKLIEIKQAYMKEQAVIIVADPDVIYDDVVQTMDFSRSSEDMKVLFPAVAFSPGIVGG